MLPTMEQNEREFSSLLHLLEMTDVRSILEVGVFQGGTLCRFAERFPHVFTVGIDTRPPWRVYMGENGSVAHCVAGSSHDPSVRQRARSINDGNPFDFAFIDGDHSYEGALQDFEWANLEIERLIAFHDIYSVESCPDVVALWKNIRLWSTFADRDGFAFGRIKHIEEFSYEENRNGIGVVWLQPLHA